MTHLMVPVTLIAGLFLAGCAESVLENASMGDAKSGTAALGASAGSRSLASDGRPNDKAAVLSQVTTNTPTAVATKSANRNSTTVPPVTAALPGSTSGYTLGIHDIIEVHVFKVPELSKVVQISESGTAGLPLIGEVPISGRTIQEAEREIASKLGAKYLKSPQVSILIKEYNSQRVTIDGAVKKPGVHSLKGNTSLMQAIATAEGLDTQVASSNVVVLRRKDGKEAKTNFDIDRIRSGQDKDPQLLAGDHVIVEPSVGKEALNNVLKALPLARLLSPL